MLLLINQKGTGALEIYRGLSTSSQRDLSVLLRPLLPGRGKISDPSLAQFFVLSLGLNLGPLRRSASSSDGVM